jgi:hypothetical protein
MRKPVDNSEKRWLTYPCVSKDTALSSRKRLPAGHLDAKRQIGGQINRPPKALSFSMESQVCAIDFRSACGDCI